MADVSHELGALRFDSSLSSKVAMFNNQVQQHKESQNLNPFSGADGRASPKPTFAKGEYGKPLAGSLTEMRGQKANMHVLREMLELCQIIDSEGYDVKDERNMRVIPFGELFNIYNYISDKVVGILLRARKHKFVEFEGEMLFQRRDDDVPIFLLRPIQDIRHEINSKIEDIKRATSPAPQATTLIIEKSAKKLSGSRSASVTPAPTPPASKPASKASSPAPELPPAKTTSPADKQASLPIAEKITESIVTEPSALSEEQETVIESQENQEQSEQKSSSNEISANTDENNNVSETKVAVTPLPIIVVEPSPVQNEDEVDNLP